MSLFHFVRFWSLTECSLQEPVKSRAPQLHLEYRFYKTLGTTGKVTDGIFIHLFHFGAAWQWFDCFGRLAQQSESFPQHAITPLGLRIDLKVGQQLFFLTFNFQDSAVYVTASTITHIESAMTLLCNVLMWKACWHSASYTPTKQMQQLMVWFSFWSDEKTSSPRVRQTTQEEM